ncbi:MAG: serine protease [Actinomycetota bacterium]
MRLIAVGLVVALLVGCNQSAPASSPASSPTDAIAPGATSDALIEQSDVPPVLALRAQACDRPQPRDGVAVVVAPSLVATAGHLVEGALRSLEVDGRAATVVALDLAADLAVLEVPFDTARPADAASTPTIGEPAVGPVRVLTAGDESRAEIIEIMTLRVNNLADDRVDERRSAKLDLDVQPGDSGSAVVDKQGALVGIVTLRRPASGVSYATTADLLSELLDTIYSAPDALTDDRNAARESESCSG